MLVRCLFFQNSFPWPSDLRVELLRSFGAKIGRGVVIRANVNISFPWRLVIGDNVWIGEDVGILSLAAVKIGSNVCISQRAYLCTGSHDFRNNDFKLKTEPIMIGDRTWVAASAFIGPGITIGSDSVISAGAIVFSDIPTNSFVRGNPAEAKPRNAMGNVPVVGS